MKNALAIAILFAAAFVTGCSANHTSTATKPIQIAVSEKTKGDSVNDAPILRCGSTLTKTKKPCQNRVKEDSFCHLHARLEAEKGAKK